MTKKPKIAKKFIPKSAQIDLKPKGDCGCGSQRGLHNFSPRASSASSLQVSTASASVCSPTGINIPANQSSCQKSYLSDGSFDVFQTYHMFVNFSSTAMQNCSNGSSCSQCEYHQFVRGYLRYRPTPNDTWQYAPLFGYGGVSIQPAPAPYVEDGGGFMGQWRYGHRCDTNVPSSADNYFDDLGYTKPDRLSGTFYKGGDKPQIYVPIAGWQYEMYLEFIGKIVDTLNSSPDDNPLATRSWTVSCSGTG